MCEHVGNSHSHHLVLKIIYRIHTYTMQSSNKVAHSNAKTKHRQHMSSNTVRSFFYLFLNANEGIRNEHLKDKIKILSKKFNPFEWPPTFSNYILYDIYPIILLYSILFHVRYFCIAVRCGLEANEIFYSVQIGWCRLSQRHCHLKRYINKNIHSTSAHMPYNIGEASYTQFAKCIFS